MALDNTAFRNVVITRELTNALLEATDYFGLVATDVMLKDWEGPHGTGATGTCKINGNVCQLPKVDENDHIRELVMRVVLNFVK